MNNHAVDGRSPASVENGGWFLPPTVWHSNMKEQFIWKYLKNWLMDAGGGFPWSTTFIQYVDVTSGQVIQPWRWFPVVADKSLWCYG